jgi:hemerythrin
MKIEWNDSYRIGNDPIDRQHQQLFELANATMLANDLPSFKVAMMQLYRYVRTHFADEEKLMRNIHFPGYEAQQGMHNNMVSQLNVISAEIGKGKWDTAAIHAFMHDWLLEHIAHEDVKIAEHIRQMAN